MELRALEQSVVLSRAVLTRIELVRIAVGVRFVSQNAVVLVVDRGLSQELLEFLVLEVVHDAVSQGFQNIGYWLVSYKGEAQHFWRLVGSGLQGLDHLAYSLFVLD